MKEKLNELSELTPIEILNDFRNRYYNDGNSTENGIVANALNDIMPRMIVPPVKVGETVYRVCKKKYDVDGYGMQWEEDMGIVTNAFHLGMLHEIGKTVFLTRKAAEEALKAREKE